MEMTIKSRKTGEVFTFWMTASGGYVYLCTKERPGSLGDQICKGGKFMGSTISSTEKSFEADCRKWYRDYMNNKADI